MTRFRILYLSDARSEAFRLKPPKTGSSVLRRNHYEEGPEVKASSPYEVWERLREQSSENSAVGVRPLAVGDALESEGRLAVCNYWGFDPAEWWEPRKAKSAAQGQRGKRRSGSRVSRARA